MSTIRENKTLTILIVLGIIITALLGFNRALTKTDKTNLDQPENLKVEVLNNTETKITWETIGETTGEIVYSQYTDLCTGGTKSAYCLESKEPSPSKSHTIVLKKLLPNKKYYFAVKTDEGLNKINGTYPSFNTEELSFGIVKTQKTSIPKSITNTAFNGFSNAKAGITQKIQTAVLGVATQRNPKDVDKVKYEEFKKAIEEQNLNYDFNNDNTVDTSDYPLFIEFITNQED